uniref:Uncharacterized protein n=1 Tax=Solanum tuberosum TaxID=4113 RepID=M0ZXG4_SOLTU
MAKNVADADKFRTNGKEYCHINTSLNQFLRGVMILCWGVFGCGNDLMVSSHLIAPFRIKAFVALQTSPTVTIFSTSPTI